VPNRQEIHRFEKQDYFFKNDKIIIEEKTLPHNVDIHYHDFFEIEFVLSGKATHIFNNRQYELSRGFLHLIMPANFHSYSLKNEDSLKYFNIRFDESVLSNELKNAICFSNRDFILKLEEDAFNQVLKQCKYMLKEFNSNSEFKEIMLQSCIQQLCVFLIRLLNSSKGPEKIQAVYDAKIQSALAYMQTNFRKKISVSDVAKLLNFSNNYFSNYFSDSVGVSFSAYLKDLRLQFAMNLLNSSNLNINEICYESGFSTLSNFTQAFKEKYGYSPKHFQSRN